MTAGELSSQTPGIRWLAAFTEALAERIRFVMPPLRFHPLQSWRCVMVVLALCVVMVGCEEPPPLKIGFMGGLTGRVADLGVAGRDGVLLAVEEKNNAGGLSGRAIELIIRDDRHQPEVARRVFHELQVENVLAIIGPMTSSIAVSVKPLIDAGRTVVVSPTVKTDQLSGQDDYFIRVTAPLSSNARQLAAYSVNRRGLQRFAVIYDRSNRAFTETWLKYFEDALKQEGGTVIDIEGFSSRPDVHFLPIAERVSALNPQAVLFLCNAIDTALLAQQFHKLGSGIPLFSSEWAFTTDLINFGGRAVEGMSSFHSFDADSRDPAYLRFRDTFTRRFGYAPSFASVLAYDAATFLFSGLDKEPSSESLKDTLLGLGSFQGLQSEFTVDAFGDVDRRLFLTRVKNGQFQVVD